MKWILAGIVALIAALADFSGTYVGDMEGAKVRMELKQSGKNLSGTADVMGLKVNVTGTVSDNTATGTMDIGGEKLHFKGTLSGSKLTLKLADVDDDGKVLWSEAETLEFKKEGGAIEPPAKTEKPTEKARPSKPADKTKADLDQAEIKPLGTLKNGKLYEHSSGGKFRYPSDWKLTEAAEYLQLLPPGAAANEFYLIMGDDAQGATDPADPNVGQYLDGQLTAQVPSMKRVGKVQHAPAGNAKGAVYTWEGDVEGVKARTKAYVTIINGAGVALVAIGPADAIKKREPILREIFFTFGWGQGKGDPRLVGEWTHWSYNATSGTEKNSKAVLRADGTFSASWDAESSGNFSGKNQYGNETWYGGYASKNGGGYGGTWFVRGNELTLNFSDGSTETWDFTITAESSGTWLRCYGTDKKKPIEWRKSG